MGLRDRFKKMFERSDKNENSDDNKEKSQNPDVEMTGNFADAEVKSSPESPNDNPASAQNFKYLDYLIHNGQKEINLKTDFSLGNGEDEKYLDGIDIKGNDVIINGCGHVIDARGKTGIFSISGENVVIKNIIIKNPHKKVAISNKGITTIDGCIFKRDGMSQNEGTIYNAKLLNIKNSTFKNNSDDVNPQIVNDDILILENVDFDSNENPILNNQTLILSDESNLNNNISNKSNIRYLDEDEGEHGFAYLEDLIKSSNGEIKLDSDIKLDMSSREYEKYFNGINIDSDEVVIDGCGHSIDANNLVPIFKIIDGAEVTLKNIILKNAYSKHHCGGAIDNGGDLTLENVKLKNNKAYSGGAIRNTSQLVIENSIFQDNESLDGHGGAIYNTDQTVLSNTIFNTNKSKANGGAIYSQSELTINNCEFNDNSSLTDRYNDGGGAIFNSHGILRITDSTFKNNSANNGGAIYDYGVLFINHGYFEKNSTEEDGGAIYNKDSNNIKSINENKVQSSIFDNNSSKKGGAILNRGYIMLELNSFKNNVSQSEDSDDIFNNGELILKDPEFSDDEKTVFNESVLHVFDDGANSLSQKIRNEGKIGKISLLKDNERNFSYLNKLINSRKEIKLEYDIRLDLYNGEGLLFKNGIFIENSDIVIDGCGHSIDGGSFSRIFVINGHNVTIKNIHLKNGYAKSGGAIFNQATDSTTLIQECVFTDNNGNDGSAIYNFSRCDLKIKDSEISNNYSEKSGSIVNEGVLTVTGGRIADNEAATGAAVYNHNKAILKNIMIENNTSINGGAIYNYCEKELEIISCKINGNSARTGGAIYNEAKLERHSKSAPKIKMQDTLMCENKSQKGGAIFNRGILDMFDSKIIENHSKKGGGAIYNDSDSHWGSIENCIFEKNSSKNGGAIRHFGYLVLKNTHFLDNEAELGGAIDNYRKIVSNDCSFSDNRAKTGGAIYNDVIEGWRIYEGSIELDNSQFKNNQSSESFSQDIYNKAKIKMNNIQFADNEKSINNQFQLLISDSDFDANEKIYNDSMIFNKLNENQRSFGFLNDLIKTGKREIILENDIVLDGWASEQDQNIYEKFVYGKGIELEHEDLTIDGNGHCIDARNAGRIFNIKSGNVTLKNIIIKNGSNEEGGAILNNGNLKIENVIFENNKAYRLYEKYTSPRGTGGVIYNNGDLDIESSKFYNSSAYKAGALYNTSKLTIFDATFFKNSNENGGCIHIESGEGEITDSKFLDNTSQIIQNKSKLTMDNCSFNKNTPEAEGNLIYNTSDLTLDKCKFIQNDCRNCEGLIYNKGSAQIMLTNSRIEQNKGTFINNAYGEVSLTSCEIFENESENHIFLNNDYLLCESCLFKSNESGNIILNNLKANLSIVKTKFINNEDLSPVSKDYETATILNKGKSANIKNCQFELKANTLNILNETELRIQDIEIKNISEKSILNQGHLIIKDKSNEISELIDNEGDIEFDEIPIEESFDFGYLDRIIHEDISKTVTLSRDIRFKEYEKYFYEGGIELDIDNLTIDGKNHTIDADNKTRIFLITGKNITLKNIVFKNGQSFKNLLESSNSNGGAILNYSKSNLRLENCRFVTNKSEIDGCALANYGKVEIIHNEFCDNVSKDSSSTVVNYGEMSIKDSQLNNNLSNNATLLNKAKCNLEIISSSIKGNFNDNGSAVSNYGKSRLEKITLKDNTSNKSNAQDIFNDGKLFLHDFKFNSTTKSILNWGKLFFKDETQLNKLIGEFDNVYYILNENQRGFNYLLELLRDSNGEIKLDYDIKLDIFEDEEKEFTSGIPIREDGTVIDGGGHSIDAKKLSRIFICGGKNILLKNITLKNGSSFRGGAIQNYSSADTSLENVTILDSDGWYGGAIHNRGTLSISKSMISNNRSNVHGAIFNSGEMEISKSILEKNHSDNNGGALTNEISGTMTLRQCELLDNEVLKIGGAIQNRGRLKLSDTIIKGNSARNGGAISNFNDGIVEIENSEVSNNSSKHYGSAIYNKKGYLIMNATKIKDNESKSNSQEIWSLSSAMELNDCELTKDLSYEKDKTQDNFKASEIPIRKFDEYEYPNSFKDIYDLIENGFNEIHLNSDIQLTKGDELYFKNGIKLNRPGIIIDGHGHTIDGNKISRIFTVTQRDITIKNITFKNCGFNHRHGGAILNKNSLTVENCKFINNNSRFGAALSNWGDVKFIKCEFRENHAGSAGGAIHSENSRNNIEFSLERRTEIINCLFEYNTCGRYGEAINSENKLIIKDSLFNNKSGMAQNTINSLSYFDYENVKINGEDMNK